MFARRIAPSAIPNAAAAAALTTIPKHSLRAFTASHCSNKAPALADVSPNGTAAFDAKVKEFREELSTRKQQREQNESQSASTVKSSSSPSSTTSSSASTSSSESDTVIAGISHTSHDGQGLGSYSTSDAGRQEQQQSEGTKKKGALSSLFYGTEEGRAMDRDIERSFSQVLARGKYVHSIVFHEVKPSKVDEYVDLIGNWYPRVAGMPENKVHLVGSWRTEVGDCDTFVHIWEYQKYEGYHASLHAIQHHPEFAEFDKRLKKLIRTKRTSLMQEFSFWPTSPPRDFGGVFELRSYTLHPGNLLEWENHWRKGLEARKEVMEGVGAWFVQVGALNVVHHLWQFPNLEERRSRREKSWGVSGWADTVHKTVPLIQTMDSRIMVPLPWSPIK